ncbi:hypothetical protein [Phenylobacterium sp.]|uniref:hypothetical protein n=1 Tax=Phenylobacterium sp. TaxID=1871053 RepID=UPI002734DC91|nr:hypothetical protein [Phenylobacterium sp.]MDP3854418.1 hypothetical protein [Phenylobacterium sp.]
MAGVGAAAAGATTGAGAATRTAATEPWRAASITTAVAAAIASPPAPTASHARLFDATLACSRMARGGVDARAAGSTASTGAAGARGAGSGAAGLVGVGTSDPARIPGRPEGDGIGAT